MQDTNNQTLDWLHDMTDIRYHRYNEARTSWEVADNTCRYLLCKDMTTPYQDIPNHDYILFIGVNPSDANANQPDPTYTVLHEKVQQLNAGDGVRFRYLVVANLFAFRTPYPEVMRQQGQQAVGDLNNWYLEHLIMGASRIVLMWGAHGSYLNRSRDVIENFIRNHHLEYRCYAFAFNQDKSPRHPLWYDYRNMAVPDFLEVGVRYHEIFHQFVDQEQMWDSMQ